MAAQDNLIKAGLIAEIKQKADQANADLTAAEAALAEAQRRLNAATGDDEKRALQPAVDTARARRDEAKKKADEAAKQLGLLLPESSNQVALYVQYGVFGLLALVVLGGLLWGIFGDTLLPALSETATSRGLITFVVALVTVTIALILVLATVVSDSPDRNQRFLQGKEVLTALIGVLGTIVGFYFGQAFDSAGKDLRIGPVAVKAEGDKVRLVAHLGEGKSPFSYDVTFTGAAVADVKKGQSADGLVVIDLAAPAVTKQTEVSFVITAKDSEGRTGAYNGQFTLQPPAGAEGKKAPEGK